MSATNGYHHYHPRSHRLSDGAKILESEGGFAPSFFIQSAIDFDFDSAYTYITETQTGETK